MIDGSSVVTGTVGIWACASAGSESPATSARRASRLPGSGMRTVRTGTPARDDTTCAFSLASRACICATVAPGASSSSSWVRTYSTPSSVETSSGVKLADELITSVIAEVAGGSGGPGSSAGGPSTAGRRRAARRRSLVGAAAPERAREPAELGLLLPDEARPGLPRPVCAEEALLRRRHPALERLELLGLLNAGGGGHGFHPHGRGLGRNRDGNRERCNGNQSRSAFHPMTLSPSVVMSSSRRLGLTCVASFGRRGSRRCCRPRRSSAPGTCAGPS